MRDFGIMNSRLVVEQCLDSQFWHACAGGMVQIPPVNSRVYYFPQGHAEHAQLSVDFGPLRSQIPSMVPCKVSAINYMADPETDEVFAKIRLTPLSGSTSRDDSDDGLFSGVDGMESSQEKTASFAKQLTQSDANNGGGFSVPRYCAETIFPRLDYNAEPPVQTILAKDVHGETWKFRHIYRGTPRRHLLTTGWSNFVNQKKLVAGDSIVFLRADNGDLCVGIRRARRGIGGGSECPSGWNSYGFMREDDCSNPMRKNVNGDVKAKIRPESVVEAATFAAKGHPFEVVYYPSAGTPEYWVRASAVRAAMQIQWYPGMRFKMPFETEDSSRISCFMGTISSVQVAEPIHWPNSPWRLLQVEWDEPELLHNVKRVNPWLVELVSSMPAIHIAPFSPPRKKLRFPQTPDFSLMGQLSLPSFTGNSLRSNSPLCCVPNNIPASIQGARQFDLPSSDLHFNKLQTGLSPFGFEQLAAPTSNIPINNSTAKANSDENVSCLLTIGSSSPKESSETTKIPHIFLFGQLIVPDQHGSSRSSSGESSNGNSTSVGNTEKNMMMTNVSEGSGSSVYQNGPLENSSDAGSPQYKHLPKTDLGSDPGHHCQLLLESNDARRTIDQTMFGSYKELNGKLADMFGTEQSGKLANVCYRDPAGVMRRTGDEPFGEFLKRSISALTS
ncbi:Auxin response factor 18 [Linum perenne]